MADLLAYASVFRSAGAATEPRTIQTRGKQFQIAGAPSSSTQQFCIRPGCAASTGRPPRRASGGGGKYSKLRTQQQQQQQHTQVAFTMPDWQQRIAGRSAAAPASRGTITTGGPSLRPEGYASALACGSAPASKVRPAPMTLASPAYETEITGRQQQQQPFDAGQRYARPFCAEPFQAKQQQQQPKGARRYATIAVGGEDAFSMPATTRAVVDVVVDDASSSSSEEESKQQQQSGVEEQEEERLPLYWYAPAPSSSGMVDTAARWQGGGAPAVVLDWRHKRRREEDEEAMTSSSGSSTEDVVARLIARVEFLEEQQRKRSRGGGGEVDFGTAAKEQWFASAVLGLFVICVVDALRGAS